jgi:hypothetical protein
MKILLHLFTFLLIITCNGYLLEIPNDPFLPAQVYLYNTNTSKYDLGFIGFYNYWLKERKHIIDHYNSFHKNMPIIAIIDADFDVYDNDTRNSYFVNRYEIPNNNIDDDGNGWIDDYSIINIADVKTYKNTTYIEKLKSNIVENLGEQLYLTKYPPVDKFERNPYYHGQVVASIIASTQNNNIGMTGIVPEIIKVIPITAGHKQGLQWTAIRRALDYIIDMKKNGLNIVAVNMSFGGKFVKDNIFGREATIGGKNNLEDKLRALDENDILYIAAAGNYYHNIDITEFYPSSYGLDNGIVVGAATSTGRRSAPSDYGEETVDIFAVSQFDNKTVNLNDYFYRLIELDEIPYTSFATAIVSATVGIANLLFPECNYKQIKKIILESFEPISYLKRMAKYPGIVKLSGEDGQGLITDGVLNYQLIFDYCH